MQSTLSLDDLIALCRNRWMMPLLVDLADHRGARFIELMHRLALPRDSLARTLQAAAAAAWVMPNPGHGHPLRPEYILTPEGARLALASRGLMATQARLGFQPGALTRWGLPLVRTIGEGDARFNELSRSLGSATPRAISQGLQALTGHELATRTLLEGRPPGSLYRLTASGRVLAKAFEA